MPVIVIVSALDPVFGSKLVMVGVLQVRNSNLNPDPVETGVVLFVQPEISDVVPGQDDESVGSETPEKH